MVRSDGYGVVRTIVRMEVSSTSRSNDGDGMR
jgi:hypothetical protein